MRLTGCLSYLPSKFSQNQIWLLEFINLSCRFKWIIFVVDTIVVEPLRFLDRSLLRNKRKRTWRFRPYCVSTWVETWHFLNFYKFYIIFLSNHQIFFNPPQGRMLTCFRPSDLSHQSLYLKPLVIILVLYLILSSFFMILFWFVNSAVKIKRNIESNNRFQ